MEHQNPDGTLTPPTSQQSTDLPVEALAKAEQMPLRHLTMDEADLLRATRTFKDNEQLPEHLLIALNNHAFYFSEFIINNFQEGRERSQALGQINAVVVWAKWAGVKNG